MSAYRPNQEQDRIRQMIEQLERESASQAESNVTPLPSLLQMDDSQDQEDKHGELEEQEEATVAELPDEPEYLDEDYPEGEEAEVVCGETDVGSPEMVREPEEAAEASPVPCAPSAQPVLVDYNGLPPLSETIGRHRNPPVIPPPEIPAQEEPAPKADPWATYGRTRKKVPVIPVEHQPEKQQKPKTAPRSLGEAAPLEDTDGSQPLPPSPSQPKPEANGGNSPPRNTTHHSRTMPPRRGPAGLPRAVLECAEPAAAGSLAVEDFHWEDQDIPNGEESVREVPLGEVDWNEAKLLRRMTPQVDGYPLPEEEQGEDTKAHREAGGFSWLRELTPQEGLSDIQVTEVSPDSRKELPPLKESKRREAKSYREKRGRAKNRQPASREEDGPVIRFDFQARSK